MKKTILFLSSFIGTVAMAQVDVVASSGTETATYTTVKGAFDAINAGTHQGAINITLTANTSETATAVLNRSTGTTSNFTSVSLKPATGTTATITNSTTAGPVLRILGSNVTIDGSNNGSNSRDLSIINGFATGSVVIGMGSSDAANPLSNVTIKNTTIINGAKTTGSGIIVSNAAGAQTAGYFNNIRLENNSIQKSYQGIYMIAVSAVGNGSGSVITKNDLSTSGENCNRYMGIYLGGTDGVVVSENKIGNFENTSNEGKRGIWLAVSTMNSTVSDNIIDNITVNNAGGGSATGIQIFNNAGAGGVPTANKILRNKISNLSSNGFNSSVVGISLGGSTVGTVISQNEIKNLTGLRTATTVGYGAEAIILSAGTASNTLVSNNFISKISSFAANTSSANYTGGILINAGTGYKVYNNSVYLTETQNDGTNKGVPIAFSVISSVSGAGAIDLRNNIFAVNLADTTIPAFAMSTPPVASIYSNIDNNIAYSSGPALGQTLGGPPAYTDIAGMKGILGGNDNSIKALPKFVSDSDLHIALNTENSPIDNKGVVLADVTTDFDGAARSATTPDIGADEFTIETMAVNDVANKAKVQVYPNPVNDVLTVSSDQKVNQISVYNVSGQLIQEINNSNVINLTKLSSGVYFVKTVVEGKTEMTKVIKK
ncbi:T9SS type A sorting domain-containing protein [Epilithonimonas arachidiradicis]|uniref:Putative secreted protein (Por secretion system target) n=1 Tax=Epilithonimonas arachidiradicis TaxID=1617282 RepID=A0A420D8G7_9FLAO|nr:T9SS type A sorting domain-containing protein [Epilithonimonas arachidiradicis]RKE86902.1 putative secreted protein (Por secretion system target) [Epilithonimonas arachidiradicis]GGG61199.1 T9SS C-terminal target domain-containing protein [Epilithonimonas arachidiradicis]